MGMRLHRDLEVGVISGDLEKDGFYGTECCIYGFAYQNQTLHVVIVDDETDAVIQLLKHYYAGETVSNVFCQSKRVYGDQIEIEKNKIAEQLELTIHQKTNGMNQFVSCQESAQKVMYTKEKVVHTVSGFLYWINDTKYAMVNAYFPQTVKWWLEKKCAGYEVRDIKVEVRDDSITPVQQLRRLKNSLLG